MKRRFASKFRTLLPLAVAISLVTSPFSFAPSQAQGMLNAPSIVSISPSTVSTLASTTIIITGTNFISSQCCTVTIGVSSPAFTVDSDTQITTTAPPHAAGSVGVTVSNTYGPSNSFVINYVTPVTYTVTYNGTDSTSGTPPTDTSSPYPSGATVTVLGQNTLVRNNDMFNGWKDCATNHTYGSGSTFTILGNTVLCPVWQALPMGPHTVTFKSNYTGGPVDTTQIASVPTNLTANAFTQTGFAFANWNTAANGSGTAYADSASYSFLADMTLYAQWTANAVYTITYDGNGNSGGTAPSPTTGSGSVTLATNSGVLAKTGSAFGGWNTVANGSGTSYAVGSGYNLIANITLYAVWTANTAHTVTFKSNYIGGPADTTQTASTTTNLTANSFTRLGYTFTSWNTDAAGGGMGIQYLDSASYSFAADLTVYAQWTANTAHTVTFKSNYTGGPVDTTQIASVPTNLTANPFTRPGYTFNSWNTDPAGGGMGLHFLDAASYNFAADMTVYAQWTSNTSLTVTYLGNGNSGGTVPIDSTAYASGNTVTVLGQNTLVKTGYTFGGWNSGGGVGPSITYQLGQTFTISSNTTLTANWTANGRSFTITYLGNGNTGGVAPSPTTGSGTVALATNIGNFVKTDSTFGGWNTAANGSGTPYAVASSYNLVADISLYAVWTPIVSSTTFTVTYVGNGATGGNTPVDSTLYSSGALVTVRPLGTLARNGYTFTGWDNGGSTTYQPNQTFNILSNVTLTALWATGKYAVIYDGNGNTGGDVPVDAKVYSPGSLVTVLSNGSLVKSGFTFGGWTKAGSVTVYAPTRVFIILGNTTLSAVWSASPTYTITYSGNGSTGGSVPISVTGSGSVPLATNMGGLVKTGYTFVGWNSYANGLGTLRAVGSSYLLSGNVTMYADFIPLKVSKNVPGLILHGKIVVTAPPKKIALNQIVPVHQQFLTKLPANAVGFELYENGKFAISAKSNSVFLKQIVGPKDQVTVVAVGKDGTKSAPSPVSLSKDPISLANINFNTDSYQFIGIATKILDKVAAVMIQHGYTHLDIWGYVDTQGSKASWVTLSNNRAKAVNAYMAKKLKGTGIIIKNAGRAQTQAVGNNNTAAGRALNRRVEIRVS